MNALSSNDPLAVNIDRSNPPTFDMITCNVGLRRDSTNLQLTVPESTPILSAQSPI